MTMAAQAAIAQPIILTDDDPDVPLWIAWDIAQEQWLAGLPAANTRLAYERDLRLFQEWSETQPWNVTAGLATRYRNHLDAIGRAPSTINRKLAALASFYAFVRSRYTFRHQGRELTLWPADRANPFDAVPRDHVASFGRAVYPTTAELRAILEHIHTDNRVGKRDFALILAYATTCRRATEILHIRRQDLEFLADGSVSFAYIYKGGQARRDLFSRATWAAIADYLQADGRDPAKMAPGEYLFRPIYSDRARRLPMHARTRFQPNRPIAEWTANNILKKLGKRAGVALEKCHLHGLRHAGARLRLEHMRARGAVDMLEISEKLGHANLAITTTYVAQAHTDPMDPGADDAAAALLGAKR